MKVVKFKKKEKLMRFFKKEASDVCFDNKEFQMRSAKLFLVLAIVFGLLFIFLEPPYVCPDEHTHFLNISRISHGGLFADVEDGKIGSYVTDEEKELVDTYWHYYNNNLNGNKFSLAKMNELTSRPESNTMVFHENGDSTLNPVPYILPAIVIAAVRAVGIGLNAYNSLMVAKMVNLVFYAVVIYWALKKTKLFPKTMFMLALMPMALFQGASTSYDAYLISCSFLLFAYVTRILYGDAERKITREDIFAICFAAVFIVCSKIAYAPLLLILLAIPIKKFGSLKRYIYCIAAVVSSVAVCYLIPMVVNNVITAGYVPGPNEVQVLQKEYFMDNIWGFPKLIFNTFAHYHSFYIRSFFGILGWLDTPFPKPFVFVYLFILLYVALTEAASVRGVKWLPRVLAIGGIIVFIVGTVLVMYLKWCTEVGEPYATGAQGRYFIPLIPFLMIAICSPLLNYFPRIGKKLHGSCEKIVPVTCMAYVVVTAMLLLVRYWT